MWVELWSGCHTAGFAGPVRLCWPDNKSLLEQPGVTVRMFELISGQSMKAAEGRRK